ELHEHPSVIGSSLRRMLDGGRQVVLPPLPFDLAQVPRITLSACGSAFYAGQVGRYWMEDLARIPMDADVASELRYRDPPMAESGLALLVSQSGETADTMAALRLLRERGQHVLSIVNVPESTMARESDAVLETVAGPEIGVASTKAFTAQLSVLACLALATARARGTISEAEEARLAAALLDVPGQVQAALAQWDQIGAVAERVSRARDVLYLARGALYPIAMEGALKLKEITYIHAEGYAAGEMKHGPIALIDRDVPVIAVCPSGKLFEKTASNLQEAAARGGQIVAFTDAAGAARLRGLTQDVVVLPDCDPFAAPILYAVPVQILAYQAAVLRGTDVDQPRNLAKSVTVE
ncbi:MAG: glutamine--fructose-6-phosphate transaminase (isomerizing), partial [Acetobacteraceae bacterium]|nr:glutamine--fructose-6-phosphate transaminase (isomerizing) [Acetobacteraceae bacterium]